MAIFTYTINYENYVKLSIFYVPLLSKPSTELFFNKDGVFILKTLLSESDKDLVSLNWEVDSKVFTEFSNYCSGGRVNYFKGYRNLIMNMAIHICVLHGFDYDLLPSNEILIEEHYNCFITLFYLHNVSKQFVTHVNFETYISNFFNEYTSICLSYSPNNLNYLSNISQADFVITLKVNNNDITHVLNKFFIIFCIQLFNKNKILVTLISKELESYLNELNIFIPSEMEKRTNSYILKYLKEYLKTIKTIDNTYFMYIFLKKFPFSKPLLIELINMINYKHQTYEIFTNFEMPLLAKSLWLMLNIELSDNLDENKYRLSKDKSFIEVKNLSKTLKNYISIYRINVSVKLLLDEHFKMDVRNIPLFWRQIFTINSPFFYNKNYIKGNSLNTSLPKIKSNEIIWYFEDLIVRYSSKLLQSIYLNPISLSDLKLNSKYVTIFTGYVASSREQSLQLSKISVKGYTTNKVKFDFVQLIVNIILLLIEDFTFLKCLSKGSKSGKINVYTTVIALNELLEKFIETTNYEDFSFFVLSISRILNELHYNLEIKEDNVPFFLLNYKENADIVMKTDLAETFFTTLTFLKIKPNIKNETWIGDPSELVKKKRNDIKHVIINSLKIISQYNSHAVWLLKTVSILKTDRDFQYTPFFDFRGRVYVRHTEQSWVGNVILRYNIILQLKNKHLSESSGIVKGSGTESLTEKTLKFPEWLLLLNKLHLMDMSEESEDGCSKPLKPNFGQEIYNWVNLLAIDSWKSWEDLNKELWSTFLHNFGMIDTTNQMLKWTLYNILVPYIQAFGCLQNSCASTSEWLKKGLIVYKSYIKGESINDLTLEDYIKYEAYVAVIDEALKLYKEEDLNKLTILGITKTIAIDCVTSGYTHLVGGFKSENPDELKTLLTTANFFSNDSKQDFYVKIINAIKDNILNNNIFEKLEEKFLKKENSKKTKEDKKNNPQKGGLRQRDRELNAKQSNDWFNLMEFFTIHTDDIIKRSVIKKAVMTVFYGSSYLTWYNSIAEKLSNDGAFVELVETYFNITGGELEIQLNNIIWVVAALLSLEFDNLKITEYSEKISSAFKNKGSSFKIKELFVRIDGDTIPLTYKVEKRNKQVNVNKLTGEGATSIILYNLVLGEFNKNKTENALLANVCHILDAYICRAVILRCAKLGIPIVTIHDCFIIPPLYCNLVKRLYTEIYYETYENNNFIDIIYIVTEDNHTLKLFDDICSEELSRNWSLHKDKIINSRYPLTFE